MPFYTQKPFRAEIIEVTADNINNVFTWVSASPTVNAHSLTSTSFVIVWGGTGNVTQTVEVGGYVVKRNDNAFAAMPADGRAFQKWNLLTDAEANSLPTIDMQTRSLDEAWTRFSELIF